MVTPLYEGHDNPCNPQKIPASHKGLWFERFFNQYDASWTILKPKNNEESAEKKWIDDVSGMCGEPTALQSHSISQSLLCDSLGGENLIFKNNWHFVTGMGNNHPVENGMSWHPTLGAPYLTGASVKGLLRTWMEEWSDLEEDKLKEKLFLWFGSDDKDPKKQQKNSQAGGLIFFDAIPIDQVKLACDIMTPHMGKWYSDGGNITKETYSDTLPADWHNPIPIPFLVVKQASLQFSIAPRPHSGIRLEEVQQAMRELEKALKFLGAGAKTAVGYGRFEIDAKAAKKFEKKRKENARKEMKPEESFADELKNIDDKKLAEMFGKNFNKTRAFYEKQNCQWETIIEILIAEKKTIIASWSEADKNTAEDKAYKKLRTILNS